MTKIKNDILRKLRVAKGWSQEELAKAAKFTSRQYLALSARNRRRPDRERLPSSPAR